MKRFTNGKLLDKDVAAENLEVDGWGKAITKESPQTIRNVGRIEQLEAKQSDLEQWLLKILSQSSQWITLRTSSRVQSLSWRELANIPDIVFELDEDGSLWERAQLATQPIVSPSEQFRLSYQENLSKVTKLLADLEQDFDDVGRRLVMCTLLEEELGHLEDSLEDDDSEYLALCVSLVRDVLDYNYPEDITRNHLDLLKKAVEIIYNKGPSYSKQDYQDLHKTFLEAGLALLPTSQKAIEKYQ